MRWPLGADAHPVDRLDWLIADDPRVVPRRDIDHVVWPELGLAPIIEPHMDTTREEHARVVETTAGSRDNRPHML